MTETQMFYQALKEGAIGAALRVGGAAVAIRRDLRGCKD